MPDISTKWISALTSILLLMSANRGSVDAGDVVHPADYWVATDALGRTLPTHKDVGNRKPDKVVGIFYFVWVGNHAQKVYDISKILKTPEQKRQWGPVNATHFGCEPEVGYFHASDPWVIQRDMQMLANAGVDFIYLDVTNTLIYERTVDQLLKTIAQMRKNGIRAPQVTFVTNAASGRTMNRIHDRYYSNSKLDDLWFEWQGKPLIFGIADDPVLKPEAKDRFTIKRSWAWTNARRHPDHWQWLDNFPQDFGWSESPDVPEQIPVAVASHASNSIGKSYHDGQQPTVRSDYTTEWTPHGLHFEEQWKHAHEVDPKVVMISGWNEWIAGRFIKKDQRPIFAGRPPMQDGTWFVDVFSPEFSRDIAPMKGGYNDNYYYQMVGHIRKFKGMSPRPKRPASRPITIDGVFDDWAKLDIIHQDPLGDTLHRRFRGTDPKTIYTNEYGRNDILSTHVVENDEAVNFMVRTREKLTPHTDPNWMILLIDSDQDRSTGWQGYDLAVNRTVDSDRLTNCARWQDSEWKPVGTVPMAYAGNQLELAIPRDFISRDPGQGFDFKWADNVSLKNVESLFLEGDVAPDRRFNFRY